MTTQPTCPGLPPAVASSAPEFARLWKDTERREQLARIGGLHLQSCDREGQAAWGEAHRIHADLPKGVRIDLPSPRVFGRVLGFFRSAAMLKYRPMVELQLSVKDIAAAIGYAKSVVEAALRWLGSGPILYRGQQVARGLEYITRTRRKARALVQGALKMVYRTSKTALTLVGRGFLGVGEAIKRVGRAVAPTPPRKKAEERPKDPSEDPQWGVGLETARNVFQALSPSKRTSSVQEMPNASNGWGRRRPSKSEGD